MGQRKILFKAKKLSDGKWVEGDLLHQVTYEKYGAIEGAVIREAIKSKEVKNRIVSYVLHQVDPSTVCQFTGLKDKNGKEVWEGDYLKPIFDGYKSVKVIFKNGSFCLDTPYRGLEYLPLASCDVRLGNQLVELELVGRKEGEK